MTKLWLCCAAILIAAFTLSPHTPASAVVKPPAKCSGPGIFPPGSACAGGEFCQAPTGLCAIIVLGSGTCTRVPQTCVNLNKPVCGCDFQTYKNDCARRQARVSKAKDGAC